MTTLGPIHAVAALDYGSVAAYRYVCPVFSNNVADPCLTSEDVFRPNHGIVEKFLRDRNKAPRSAKFSDGLGLNELANKRQSGKRSEELTAFHAGILA
jgi:hypothetical protein